MSYTPIARSKVNPLARYAAKLVVKLLGWGIEGGKCPVPKAVVAAAPHSSNWDLFFTLLSAAASDVPIWFMMKHTHFWWPLRVLWYYLGGVPINRGASASVVSQMVKALNKSERMYIVIPPEGTRKNVEHWKTGFYYIANEAGIPVWPWFINYKTKRTGSGDLIYTTGNIEEDFARIRAFYEENYGPMPSCRPAPRKNEPDVKSDGSEQGKEC
ncbi:MAG TPA: acyltransferase [Candidatus Hydrogenedentes bacterium]|nr:acyltransferase [Candidatus Hydrogenedentota bacterium]